MKYQSTLTGEIIDGNDPAHPTADQREEVLKKALDIWGWEVAVHRHAPQGRFVKFSADLTAAEGEYKLEVYIFPNLADSARNRPHEKRIQLTRDYTEHQTDFELGKTDSHRCLLLGIYQLSVQEVVICAWDAAVYRRHSNPSSCYVDIHGIAKAFRSGFARSQDAKGRYVCCFRPEFMHYYIENMAQLHDVEGAAPPAEVDGAQADVDENEVEPLTGGENVIYYGAPGTGKTFTVDNIVEGEICVRTVFHPDMQNSDFVGALKPVMQEDRVSYSFSPGPFALALRNALLHADKKTFLVIEELNRAPAAAVFGDLFLLLDRGEGGAGKYDVDFPTSEFHTWLCSSVGREIDRISLPSNLWLLATMNSADQGVYPIDTAFRRRWRQDYVPIDYSTAPTGTLEIVLADGSGITIEWGEFARIINEHLTSRLSIAEDRLLGPWFVTGEDLSASAFIPGKVLIYLWDDLLRHHGREQVFDLHAVKTFGEVSSLIKDGRRIFSDELLEKLGDEAAAA